MIAEASTDSHTLTIVFSGLAGIASVGASLLFSWLRSDIRNLAEKIETDAKARSVKESEWTRIIGVLEGKGII